MAPEREGIGGIFGVCLSAPHRDIFFQNCWLFELTESRKGMLQGVASYSGAPGWALLEDDLEWF